MNRFIMSLLSIGMLSASVLAPGESLASTKSQNNVIVAQGTSLLAQGNFVKVEHPTQGQAKLVQEGNKRYIEFSNNFKTDNGPALEVILHKSDRVGLQIKENDYVTIGKLKKVNGGQRYEIPASIDVSSFKSVAVWCERFNATFGYATLAGK